MTGVQTCALPILVDNTDHALMLVNLDYVDGYTTVFEVKFKNGYFGLQVYYEKDGTVEEVVGAEEGG